MSFVLVFVLVKKSVVERVGECGSDYARVDVWRAALEDGWVARAGLRCGNGKWMEEEGPVWYELAQTRSLSSDVQGFGSCSCFCCCQGPWKIMSSTVWHRRSYCANSRPRCGWPREALSNKTDMTVTLPPSHRGSVWRISRRSGVWRVALERSCRAQPFGESVQQKKTCMLQLLLMQGIGRQQHQCKPICT